jgi:hypothetical protein
MYFCAFHYVSAAQARGSQRKTFCPVGNMTARMGQNSCGIPLDFIAECAALSYLQTHIFLCYGYLLEIMRRSTPLRCWAFAAYNVLRAWVDFSRF